MPEAFIARILVSSLCSRGVGPWPTKHFAANAALRKNPLIPKVQNSLFQARISLLAKSPSNEEDSSLQGTGRRKWKMGPYSVASLTIHTLSLFSSDFQLSFPLTCSSFRFPRSEETHLFGAKPLVEIVWFWNYPSALNKVGKPSFQSSKHHIRPKLSNFNLVLTQKW